MKLLIVMRLIPDGLGHHILPKCDMLEVEEIFIVRDVPGPAMPKVTYHCPPKSFTEIPFLLIPRKLLMLLITLHLSLTKKPDIIISYAMYPHGIIAFLVAKLTRRPLVISIIHINEMDFFGLFFQSLYLSILRRCVAITTTGSKTKEKLVGRGIVPEKILILPHAVDTDRFYPADSVKTYDVLYLGRVYEKKHPDILLRALYQVKNSSRKEITLCIAGSGSPDYRKYLKQMILELNLTSNVTFAGFVPDTAAIYNRSRIYALPTEAEGLPFTMLEAMACGLPVITTDVGDITDSARNNVNAIIIKHWNDIDAFATGIRRLLERPDFYSELQRNGIREIHDHHQNWNVMETWRAIFHRIRLPAEIFLKGDS